MRAQHQKKLTDNEKAQLRGNLSAYIAEHPARAPFFVRFFDWLDAGAGAFSSVRFRFAFSFALIFIIAGGGVSAAAEYALPGDTLYAVKVGFNEKVAVAFAFTPESQAHYNAQLAERRLQEAEVLAASGEFSEEARALIESHLDTVTADFNAQIASIATSSERGAVVAANAQSELEATFTAHAQVLAAISNAVPKASSVVAPFEAAVHKHIALARGARTKLDDQLAASSSAPLAAAAEASGEGAAEASEIVQALVPQAAENLGTSSSEAVAKSASDVEQAVAEGNKHMRERSYGKALGAFQSAIRAAQQTKAAVSATEQLKKVIPADALPHALGADARESAATSATNSANSEPHSSGE